MAGCIEWKEGLQNGYGVTFINGKRVYIHRLVMAILKPEEFKKFPNVNHKCDNKKCFNPEHLYCGTPLDNSRDKLLKNVDVEKRFDHEDWLKVEYLVRMYLPEIQSKALSKDQIVMSNRTETVTFRILREHAASIKADLPPGETGSSLVRNLLSLYFKGLIPKSWVFQQSKKPVVQPIIDKDSTEKLSA